MKKIIIAATLALTSMSASASVDIQEALDRIYNDTRISLTDVKSIQDRAVANFTYVDEAVDSWNVYNVQNKFYGDCDDFALSMKAAVGAGAVFYANTSEGYAHAIFVYKGMVWDMDGVMKGTDQFMRDGGRIHWDKEMTAEMKNFSGLVASLVQ